MNSILECPAPRSDEAASRPTCSDEGLLLEYRDRGDCEAFEELVRRYEKELYGYLWNRLGDCQLADDVFQQTFLQIHLKCGQFDCTRKFRPWLYTIAINQAIDLQRQNARHRAVSLDRQVRGNLETDTASLLDLVEGSGRGPAERAQVSEQCESLHWAIGRLPEPMRQAVLLVYFQGLQYREAAEVLSVPVGTVKSRVHAAVQVLGDALRPPFGRDD